MSRDALIVGINNYQYFPTLRAPAVDAEAIATCLEQHGNFNKIQRMPELIEQTNGNKTSAISSTQTVSRRHLKKAIKQLFRPGSTQAPETALLYFSGHGMQDTEGYNKGYLAASDTNPDDPDSGISLRWLQWLLSESEVKQQIVWLDCCHSGSFLIKLDEANPGHDENRDRCFIASSRDFELSWEDLNSSYSVLTKALLEGLDPTRLPGRWINSSALVTYINQTLKGELQVPVCTMFGEAINLTRNLHLKSKSTVQNDSNAVCPYKGLDYFEDNDVDYQYFYGRQALTDELLDAVRKSNFVAIVGASGSGKSSVLRAGLLYQLRQGVRISGSDQWEIRLMVPGDNPCHSLSSIFVDSNTDSLERALQLEKAETLLKNRADGLRRLVETLNAERMMLIIDQFEEVFTLCQDDAERQRFFDTVLGALATTKGRLCVVLGIRADFVGRCFEQHYNGLADLIRDHMVPVKPMTNLELAQAIELPAKQVKLDLEPELIQTLIEDVNNSPGSLPLLQYTLKELWQQRQGDQLVLSAYQMLGGINGTLDERATEIYNNFDSSKQLTVQHVFQQLTQLGEGAEDTRRRVFLDNLIAEPLHTLEQVQAVIEILANKNNRLLVTSEMVNKGEKSERCVIIDVAHEALIRHWRLLRHWIEQNRDLLRQQRRIEANALIWQEHKQSKGYLLQGFPLNTALHFQKHQADIFPLSVSAKAYLKKSARQRHLNRLKQTSSFLIITAILLDFPLHTRYVQQQHYSKFNRADQAAERASLVFLTKGCRLNGGTVTGYFKERFRKQYCRSLKDQQFSKAATFSGLDLRKADLSSTELRKADLSNADLSNANLSKASLNEANLSKANFNEVNLRDADIIYTNLRDINLNNANLSNANPRDSDLRNANLSNADLSNADLTSSRFGNVILSNADLSNAIVMAVDLSDTKGLTQQQLAGEEPPLICHTLLPDNIEIEGGKDRDCDKMTVILRQRYPNWFETLEKADEYLMDRRQEIWE